MMGRRFLRSFIKDPRGVAAVEFALIAPLMVAFYLGLTELCGAFMAQKRMGHVTALVADLITQEEAVSTDNIDGMFNISDVIMEPFSSAGLHQRVRSISLIDGDTVVNWSYTNNSDVFSDTSVSLPDDLLEEGQSVIMSEAVYDFDSPVKYLVPGGMTFQARYFLRPRLVDAIACSTCTS